MCCVYIETQMDAYHTMYAQHTYTQAGTRTRTHTTDTHKSEEEEEKK